MPGEDYPHRIVFDFDRIESIKAFDREMQTSVEKLEHLVIYPMKETVWTDSLIEKLKKRLDLLTRETETSCALLIDDLINAREAEGEEFFYPIVHDEEGKNASVLDYASQDTAVFFIRVFTKKPVHFIPNVLYRRLKPNSSTLNNSYASATNVFCSVPFIPNTGALINRLKSIATRREAFSAI